MITAGQIREHESRCRPHLLRQRMLASAEAGAGLAQRASAEVREATDAVIAEAEAATDPAVSSRRRSGFGS
jgi:hypothetical protein